MDEVENFVEFCESDFGREVMDREAEFLRGSIDRGDRVLDVGTGIGWLEEHLSGYEAVGLDVSRPMLLEAGDRSDAGFVQGDAGRLPFRHASFDAAFFVATLQFLYDYAAALQEVHRVLREGGKLAALVLNPESRYVERHLEKEKSYFHGMEVREPDEILEAVEELFTTESRYFLGISGDDIFETRDPGQAATIAIRGEKRVSAEG